MPSSKNSKNGISLRTVSSGSKIGSQVMMFIVLVVLPWFLPNWVHFEHKTAITVNLTIALLTSLFYEFIRNYREKKGKETKLIVNIQLLTSVILLTHFLHYFGYINGPFFVLFLLTIMESFLNNNIFISNVVVSIMIFSTVGEFVWLISTGGITFSFTVLLQLGIRIISLVFMRSYGNALGQKIIEEQEAKVKLQDAEVQIKAQLSDLEEKNKFLAALRRLDLIIMEALELEALCQKIVDALAWELKCNFGVIGLVDDVKNRFYFRAITSQSELAKFLIKKRIKIDELYLPLDGDYNLLTKAIETKRELSTTQLHDIFPNHLLAKQLDQYLHSSNNNHETNTYWIYPMISKKKVLGVMLFAWEKAERELSSRERDMMQNVVDQTGIALDNTLLYEKLKENVYQLKRANIKLRELDRMKDEFVSIASHELRTPMTAVNNFIWMVLHGKGGKITAKQQFYLERAAISTQRLINLVEDMLTVSRIEGGKLEVNPIPGNIVKLTKTVVEEIEPKAKEKRIKLFLEPPKHELPLVLMDADRIREVLTNLISNAIKFTDSRGQVIVSFKKKGDRVATLISDTGRGIARADISKLFKKFGRLDRSFATVAETGGTGLGLYICKQIIDLHHGKIGVVSTPGKGSTFNFDLKIVKEEKKS